MQRLAGAGPFVTHLAQASPYFGLELLTISTASFRELFLKTYSNALLEDGNSVLYDEVRQNQTTDGNGRYQFDQFNRILYFFFGEPDFRADDLRLFTPIGEIVLQKLRNWGRSPLGDSYRGPLLEYFVSGRNKCPIFVGLRVFDFMVTEALHRGVGWHMWLMYTEYWVQGIVKNMSSLEPDVDLSREHPTPYHYLLYEIVSTQCKWLEMAGKVDEHLPSVNLKVSSSGDHGSIAQSTALSIGRSFRAIVESDNLTPAFKGYMLDVVTYAYSNVSNSGRHELLKRYEWALRKGGASHLDQDSYRLGLAQALGTVNDLEHRLDAGGPLLVILRNVAAQREE